MKTDKYRLFKTSVDAKDLNKRLSLGSQEKTSWCGPASLFYAAFEQDNNNLPKQKNIAKTIGTTYEKGTSHKMMIEGAKLLGFEAYWLENTSLAELQKLKEKGNSIIVNWMDGKNIEDDGHYSLMIKCEDGLVYLQDPSYPERITVMKQNTFEDENIWFDTCDGINYLHSALVLKNPNR